MRARPRLIVFFCIGAAVAGGVFFLRSQYVAPIAMYHSVKPEAIPGNRLVLSVPTFRKQMEFLKKSGYTVMPLAEAGDRMRRNLPLPRKMIVLTFDDGYEDNFLYAFPVLQEFRFPATIFMVTNDIDTPGKLSSEQIRQMQASGLISFGSHTRTHPFLENIADNSLLESELNGSRKDLQALLGTEVESFSYPCGRFNPEVIFKVKQAGYSVGVVTNPGKNHPNDDVMALKRIRISESSSNLFIFWFETSGYYNFIRENRHK